jgi:hypothetical protein
MSAHASGMDASGMVWSSSIELKQRSGSNEHDR